MTVLRIIRDAAIFGYASIIGVMLAGSVTGYVIYGICVVAFIADLWMIWKTKN